MGSTDLHWVDQLCVSKISHLHGWVLTWDPQALLGTSGAYFQYAKQLLWHRRYQLFQEHGCSQQQLLHSSVHFSVEELIILKILISVNLLWFFLELLAQSHFSQTAQLVLHSLISESQECGERVKKACCISGLQLKLSQRATSATLSSRAHQKKQSEINRYGPVLKDL